VLAGRYRIVAALGKGGMGEVYRADDLVLGQPVALKFLPEGPAHDADLLRRFRKEVRIAREVSHPNVCRVHDLVAVDGQSFLTMEYIDGEDLAALLKKVGRLPEDRGLRLARQLCLGLAAAHDKGVIHRDLKPRNIMIDARGQVRITDFGLAVFAEDLQATAVCAGTPAYMAPEQLAGKEVSVQSDLFALGLILYEVFTGQRAFPAVGPEGPAGLYAEGGPVKPSSHVTGLDPAVERVILRCLEQGPKGRPKSAYEVLAGLPGGDPLAAALAAGEVPSPEVVANAGGPGGLHPLPGAAALAAVVLGVVLVALLNGRTRLFRQVPSELSPAELAFTARGLLRQLGHADPAADSAWGVAEDMASRRFLEERDGSPRGWRGLDTGQPAVLYFWYRESPRPLAQKGASLRLGFQGVPGRVTPADPPPTGPGMVSVFLDLKGRLIGLVAAPPAGARAGPAPPADWGALFRAAGLERQRFESTLPEWAPPVYADERAAWVGVYSERPEIGLRVEAAAAGGRPVFFHLGPGGRPADLSGPAPPNDRTARAFMWLLSGLSVVILTVGAFLARHNLRLGRANRAGAFRLAAYFFAVYLLAWAVGAKHVLAFDEEVAVLTAMLGLALLWVGQMWLAYLALEPYVRRRWPGWVVSWNRLLAGRFRDPLVGRDVLIGCAYGALFTVLDQVRMLAPTWFGQTPEGALAPLCDPLTSGAAFVVLLGQVTALESLFDLFLIFVLFLVLRREWAAFTAFVVLYTVPWLGEHPAPDVLFLLALQVVGLFVLRRVGLLAYVVGAYAYFLLAWPPLTTEPAAWYSGQGLTCVLVLLGLAVYGFVVALGGRPLFRDTLFQGAPAP
jgi:serine/threonine-protein kinase